MQEKTNQNLIQEAIRLAGTPAGQQLLALLKNNGGDELNQAMNLAASGNCEQAKQILSELLSDPQAKMLLEQLGGK